jgi:hypothetical protein
VGPPFSNRYLRGADGSQIAYQAILHDNELDADCLTTLKAGGVTTGYCVPTGAVIAQEYANSTCTQPMIAATGAAPAFLTSIPSQFDCDAISQVFTVGAATMLSTEYTSVTFGCSSAPSSESFYLGEQQIMLQPLAHHPVKQPGRRIENAVRTVGIQVFLDFDFFDTTLGTWCAPSEVGSGVTCVPEGRAVESYFTDAACSNSILVVDLTQQERCQGGQLPYAVDTRGSLAIRPVTNTFLTQLYRQQDSTCQPTNQQFFSTVGNPVDPSTFAAGAIAMDPVMP